ncbi:hypothetical protein ANCCAN_18101 [Ancylostoma caninum]|uniref:Uncharacterized protein n=1 Tax=Ancylostoma caninum TaxID=29170 RepID=A0A368FV29_ANCCA|nr:hypothetical protein ANCCAN_18101 [Ancylostoma caninum]
MEFSLSLLGKHKAQNLAMFRRSDFRPPDRVGARVYGENVEEYILERHRERLYAAQLEEQESNSNRNEVESGLAEDMLGLGQDELSQGPNVDYESRRDVRSYGYDQIGKKWIPNNRQAKRPAPQLDPEDSPLQDVSTEQNVNENEDLCYAYAYAAADYGTKNFL